MIIKTKKTAKTLTFCLEGELDECASHSARALMDGAIESAGKQIGVVFDLKKLSFMDSTGIGVLLGRYKKLVRAGSGVYIANPTPAVDKVLTAGGVYRVISRI